MASDASEAAGASPMGFAERLRRRQQLWWSSRGLGNRLKRLAAIHIERRAASSGAGFDWKRGDPYWQRRLSNKANARRFVAAQGVRVPELFWSGRRLAKLPWGELPSHFVLRPTFGFGDAGVFVVADGVNLFYPGQHQLAMVRTAVRAAVGRWSLHPLLVEEFLCSEDGRLRLLDGYQFHVFGERVALVEVTERSQSEARPDLDPTQKVGTYNRVSTYTPDWSPYLAGVASKYVARHRPEPPRCYAEMLAVAKELGRAYETYVRVDLYATDRGCVFGEFSTQPYGGQGFSAQADQLMGEAWASEIPDRN